jgi:hypothetical protein
MNQTVLEQGSRCLPALLSESKWLCYIFIISLKGKDKRLFTICEKISTINRKDMTELKLDKNYQGACFSDLYYQGRLVRSCKFGDFSFGMRFAIVDFNRKRFPGRMDSFRMGTQ